MERKRAAILCPGPSLARVTREFLAGEGYGLVIGVNRAVQALPCDAWVMLDDHTFEMGMSGNGVIGRPLLVCNPHDWRRITKRISAEQAAEFRVFHPQEIDVDRKRARWHTWSFTAAIAYAHHAGARQIECWGNDWAGESDWDGYFKEGVQQRQPERWEREKKVFDALVETLNELGTTVTRNWIGDNAEFSNGPEGMPVAEPTAEIMTMEAAAL